MFSNFSLFFSTGGRKGGRKDERNCLTIHDLPLLNLFLLRISLREDDDHSNEDIVDNCNVTHDNEDDNDENISIVFCIVYVYVGIVVGVMEIIYMALTVVCPSSIEKRTVVSAVPVMVRGYNGAHLSLHIEICRDFFIDTKTKRKKKNKRTLSQGRTFDWREAEMEPLGLSSGEQREF